ncbi:MAG: glycosyltransferase [bacterium]
MKIAIIHDWLVTYGGAERVLKEMLSIYPDADLYTLIDFLKEREFILNKEVKTSFLQKFPFVKEKYRSYLPFMPCAIERFDLSSYDMIISSCHCVSKGIRKKKGQIHICYCHTPIRYVWELKRDYLAQIRGIKGAMANIFLNFIKDWDLKAAKNVDHFIANSHYIKERIKRYYNRDAVCIYPPIDIERFEIGEKKDNFFITGGRLVPYKRFDLVINAFSKLSLPLLVFGDGPCIKDLKDRAGKNIEFLGWQDEDRLKEYLKKARAFVFAGIEDFGILPVEAQACGTPVIAYGEGGLKETVILYKTGVFFYEQKEEALISAIKEFNKREFLPKIIRENAERFGRERFIKEFKDFVKEKLNEKI